LLARITKIVIFIFGGVLIVELCLSLYVGQVLSPYEFLRSVKIISKATVLHGAGLEALRIIKDSRSNSVKACELMAKDIDGRKLENGKLYTIPLPKHSVLKEGDMYNQTYISVLTDHELQEFWNLDLKKAGWEFVDQGGSLRTFQQELNGHKILLNINIGYYLTSDIVELKFSAVAK
jgi:hypothetical protein